MDDWELGLESRSGPRSHYSVAGRLAQLATLPSPRPSAPLGPSHTHEARPRKVKASREVGMPAAKGKPAALSPARAREFRPHPPPPPHQAPDSHFHSHGRRSAPRRNFREGR
jgi:hypothetical protein